MSSKLSKPKPPSDLRIVTVPINEPNPATYNPRKWDETALVRLTESLEKYGFVDPIILNGAKSRRNIVIGGHMRLEAAKRLDMKVVPVVYVHLRSVAQEKELNLRLNRTTGEWDFEKLKNFDIEMLMDVGFAESELSSIWDGMLETEDDGFDVEKELEAIKKPKTKSGQLIALGNHRLFCGDATNAADVQKLMGNAKADMVYLDPPYNITLDYNKGVGGSMRYGGKTKDNKSNEEYAAFLTSAFQNALSAAKPACHFFCYCNHSYIGLLHTLFAQVGLRPQRTCLWIKNNLNVTLEVAFSKCYEPCVYGIRGKPYLNKSIRNVTEIQNKEIGSGNRAVDDILDLLDIWLAHRIHNSQYEHPTEKPPTLHEKPLRRCTKPGDVVLDLFGGSGSTLIACEQLKRRAFLMEVEPVFCDLIIRRFEALTGAKASLLKP
jgi:DNA modification methylase